MECGPEEWSRLITDLPAVQDCQIIMDGCELRELHVLADQSRSPKQIVRDIQSALMARYHLPVDHHRISIAQVPGRSYTQGRLICSRINISVNRDGADITVSLMLGDQTSEAQAPCGLTRSDRRRAIAKATVQAISTFLPPGQQLWLTDVGATSLSGQSVLLVSVTLFTERGSEELIGDVLEKSDPDLAIVHATLDAINRRIRFS